MPERNDNMRTEITQGPGYDTGDARWEAVETRDANAGADFIYAVRTTGVYCRPSSSARLPKRENVEFFDSAEAAEAAGYRASRRAPGDRTTAAAKRADLIAQACRLIESAETAPHLDELAAQAGMSSFHFHRIFKAETGLTPQAYVTAHHARKLREKFNAASGTKRESGVEGKR